MAKSRSAEIVARNQRLADLARQEKAVLAALDRATARLAEARARRDAVVTRADEALAAAEATRTAALAAYARVAGAERAALTLGEDVRELRRLAREAGVAPSANGRRFGADDTGAAHPSQARRTTAPPDDPTAV